MEQRDVDAGGDERTAQVLCIEDTEDDFEAVRLSLERHLDMPIAVVHAPTGREGLHAMRRRQVDVVVLDYLLPDMDGLEVMEIMRREGIDLPVIMLTGKGDETVAVKAMKRGIHDYIVKEDLETEKLSDSVGRVLELTMFLRGHDAVLTEFHMPGKRRGTLVILANILTASIHGINKTMLVHRTNLNFKTVKKYLLFLLDNDFLSVHHVEGKDMYKTTEKGLLLLQKLREVKQYLE